MPNPISATSLPAPASTIYPLDSPKDSPFGTMDKMASAQSASHSSATPADTPRPSESLANLLTPLSITDETALAQSASGSSVTPAGTSLLANFPTPFSTMDEMVSAQSASSSSTTPADIPLSANSHTFHSNRHNDIHSTKFAFSYRDGCYSNRDPISAYTF